jgi:hypothetical protein
LSVVQGWIETHTPASASTLFLKQPSRLSPQPSATAGSHEARRAPDWEQIVPPTPAVEVSPGPQRSEQKSVPPRGRAAKHIIGCWERSVPQPGSVAVGSQG